MKNLSSRVESNQTGPHSELLRTVDRHLQHPDQTPLAAFSLQTWPGLQAFLQQSPQRILDLGCGVGESTAHLARAHPEACVLGVDRSFDRLTRAPDLPSNARLVRGDSFDVLRLAHQHQLMIDKIYLLYPNPTPKSKHLQRRWHGHAIWPTLLKLTSHLELRTNWAIYAEEFALALRHCGWQSSLECFQPQVAQSVVGKHQPQVAQSVVGKHQPQDPITPFERKYAASGHALWRVLGFRSTEFLQPPKAFSTVNQIRVEGKR